MPPSRAPVPWVPVEIAPAMVCASMSPRLVMASPSVSSSALSRRIVVPERTVTCPVSRSTRSTPVQWRRSSASESATAIAVKECPLPQGRTVRPAAATAWTVAAISATLRGW
jgi:hypothetical protein